MNGDYTSATPFMAHSLPAGLKVAFFHFVGTASNVSLDMHMLRAKNVGWGYGAGEYKVWS